MRNDRTAASVVIGLALGVAACGGAPRGDARTTAEEDRRECTAALRFEEPGSGDPGSGEPGSGGPGSGEPGVEGPGGDVPTDTEEVPHTEVSLVLICEREPTRRVAIGTEVGACFREEDDRVLLAARCWWAGSGAMIHVERDADTLVVRRAGIDESSGIGRYEESARLDVPPGAILSAL